MITVVYVHGLWLRGHEGTLLRRRLARALDAEVRAFTYPSVTAAVADNAAALHRYLATLRTDALHLVAHSLGGLVILKMFEDAAASGVQLPPGRVVFLGSPVRGSVSALRLSRLPFGWGDALLGVSAGEVLVTSRERRWGGVRELGVIAGSLPFGAGRLLGRIDEPNDGTVLVRETDLPGATAQLQLRVSHSGMPFSALVARQTAAFLKDGRFREHSRS